VTGGLLLRLASFIDTEVRAVVPHQKDGRPQPLCALYATAACLAVSEELIRAGELRPRVLLERVRARRLAFDELSDLPGAELFFHNVNTPEDYTEAQIKVGSRNAER
jgi:molybdopterin-guanine dinucleotide biosynthesis protein A